jgi:hypothetical protein
MTEDRSRLEQLYLEAVYEVDPASGKVVFRIGQPIPALAGQPFALVTAWNPGLERPSRAANEAANLALQARIRGLGWAFLPGRGRDESGTHVEPSFAVFGISFKRAAAVAGDFGQAAFVWFDGETARIAWLEEAGPPGAP